MTTKKALIWVGIWVGLALLFDAGIYMFLGKVKAIEFLGGYVIEQSLSIDNLFLFLMVFSSFGIKSEYQRRILNYGIAGAIILRLIFIVLGITIINMFHWILYIFGIILIISGTKMAIKKDEDIDHSDSKIVKVLSKIMPVTKCLDGNKFFVRQDHKLCATPLFAVLILIELTDVIFAIDSIPAVFSISTDPFIVYTSNIFAILGLRSMYFLLGKLHEKFKYVKYGVAAILTFTGVKLAILFFDIHIPTGWSLGIIFTILVGSIITSVVFSNRNAPASVPKNIPESITE